MTPIIVLTTSNRLLSTEEQALVQLLDSPLSEEIIPRLANLLGGKTGYLGFPVSLEHLKEKFEVYGFETCTLSLGEYAEQAILDQGLGYQALGSCSSLVVNIKENGVIIADDYFDQEVHSEEEVDTLLKEVSFWYQKNSKTLGFRMLPLTAHSRRLSWVFARVQNGVFTLITEEEFLSFSIDSIPDKGIAWWAYREYTKGFQLWYTSSLGGPITWSDIPSNGLQFVTIKDFKSHQGSWTYLCFLNSDQVLCMPQEEAVKVLELPIPSKDGEDIIKMSGFLFFLETLEGFLCPFEVYVEEGKDVQRCGWESAVSLESLSSLPEFKDIISYLTDKVGTTSEGKTLEGEALSGEKWIAYDHYRANRALVSKLKEQGYFRISGKLHPTTQKMLLGEGILFDLK